MFQKSREDQDDYWNAEEEEWQERQASLLGIQCCNQEGKRWWWECMKSNGLERYLGVNIDKTQ